MSKPASRIAALICLLMMAGCFNSGENTAMENNSTRSQLAQFNIQFDHPNDLTLQNESEDRVRYCFKSELGQRYTRCLIFTTMGNIGVDESYDEIKLSSGNSFHYLTETVNVGSGGAEHRISGYFQVNTSTIFVKANADERAGYSDASWVLPILQTIR